MAARGRRPADRRVARARRRNQGSDLGARIVVALPAIAFAVFIVAAGGWVFAAALALLGIICVGEAFSLLRAAHPVRLAGFLGLIALLVAARLGGPPAVLGALVACVPLAFAIGLLQPRAGAPGVAVTVFVIVWIGVALAHAVMLRDLAHGDGIVIDVLVGTFLGDTAAYLGGRAFGQRPLAQSISPNKTVEGWLIGMAGAVAGVFFAGLYQDWLTNGQALLLGLAVAVVAPWGDLFESYLKRDRQAKDSGRLFGAHGGALDRLDAVLFTAVAAYYVWHAMV
jgi:phosphatidate cytidylyltransferase